MQGNSLFRKLTAFAKFDMKRFGGDADLVKVNRPKQDLNGAAAVENSVAQKELGQQEKAGSESEGKRKKKKKQKKKTAAQLALRREEELNHLRNKHHIHANGTDVPPPLASFQELQDTYGVSEVILRNVLAQGYAEPTGIQRQAVPLMLQGRDTMACAPTGSGKTAAFIVPVLHDLSQLMGEENGEENRGPRALILVPTRELAKQSQREFRKLSKGLGLKICVVEKEQTMAKKCQQQFDILVTTPNRLIYMLKNELPLVTVSNLRWLVVDECDKMFEAGKQGFRDQLGTIYQACSNPNLRRALFSATFAQDVEEWCKLNLDNVVQVHIGAKNTATNTVLQELVFTGDEYGKLLAFRNLIKEGMTPPVLVFVQSKDRAKQLYTELMYENIRIDVMHADRPQGQRDEVVKNFRLGLIWVLVCTELMGRGIDFKGVNLVVNYDFPTSAISYIHRVGRTGRAGKKGRAVTFFTENDKPLLRNIAGMIRQAGCPVPEYMTAMKRPGKKERRNLAQNVPERKSILTMDVRDQERLKRKRKLVHKQSKDRKKMKLSAKPASQNQK
ncbi:probable ATP-dependent RNA helicase DDX52 [Aplysia californica]|uniref:Probable ATP-dependent RNA helicase DDX52 n=1 Tax=Aplysia californica TaxID=6500 RepID=A0ABM1A7V5_APLCA|nr:probable ATP-dependent RNA helicase DDX52 [Aplysia californica]XP_005090696.1 probable ATP-dependent RNA helicase DDX52 [Aplysia californica]XP_012942530.1 probable ATP-dependent RNA helicase DDX52 [Aplysia californica]